VRHTRDDRGREVVGGRADYKGNLGGGLEGGRGNRRGQGVCRSQRGGGGDRTLLSSPWPDGPICPCLSHRRPSFSPSLRALHLLVVLRPAALGSPSQLKLENIDHRKNHFQAAPKMNPSQTETNQDTRRGGSWIDDARCSCRTSRSYSRQTSG
jgi:hypothetical protein